EIEPPAELRERVLAAARTTNGAGYAEPLPLPDRAVTSEPAERRQNGVRTGAPAVDEAPAGTVSPPLVLRPRTGRERGGWQTPAALLAAAAMLALAVGLGAWNVDLHRQLDDRASAQQLQDRVLA